MGKFTGVLLASDFDNTLIYTEEALRSGVPVPPLLRRTGRRWSASWRRVAALPLLPAGPWRPF